MLYDLRVSTLEAFRDRFRDWLDENHTAAPARTFAAHLYSGLAFGRSLKSAFHQACAAIGDEPDSAVPQLFFRNGGDPHKTVLVRPAAHDNDRQA